MKKRLPLVIWCLCVLSGMNILADVVTMRDGRQIPGTIESGTETEIRIQRGGTTQVLAVDQIQSIRLDAPVAVPPTVYPQARSEAPRVSVEPEFIGVVYAQTPSGALIPLERKTAVRHSRFGSESWEMDGAKSSIRVKDGGKARFVVRLANGIDPNTFKLYPLEVREGRRRTQANPRNRNAALTLTFNVTKVGQFSYGMIPAASLAAGEYAFSPITSDDSYCFGVDPLGSGPSPEVQSRVQSSAGANGYNTPPRAIAPAEERPTLRMSGSSEEDLTGRQRDDSTDAIIASARSAAASFWAGLPELFAQRVTTRNVGGRSLDQWHTVDQVTADLNLVNGEEHYSNTRVNGRTTDRPQDTGAWSTGEFKIRLERILSRATAAIFTSSGEGPVGNRQAWVFDYRVEQSRSEWMVYDGAKSCTPAYRGQIWIDKESRRVLRLEMRAVDLPRGFNLDNIESSLEYGNVSIGGVAFLLPVLGTDLSCDTSTPNCKRNVTEFRGYRKF